MIKTMNFVPETVDFIPETVDFILNQMNFILKMMDFALKMMSLAGKTGKGVIVLSPFERNFLKELTGKGLVYDLH